MEIYIYLLTALAVGVVTGYGVNRVKVAKMLFRQEAFEKEVQQLRAENEALQKNRLEIARMQERAEYMQRQTEIDAKRWIDEKTALRQQGQDEREELLRRFEKEKTEREENYRKTFEQLKQNFSDIKAEMERQWKERTELMKGEFQVLAGEVLKKQSDELSRSGHEGWEKLMVPLQEKMTAFEKAVRENKEKSVENTATLETSIRHLMERSQEIGREAEKLTGALRGDSKVQGDWGEMVLERLLEMSGLRKNEEYFVQMNVESTAEEGVRMRPDVVVRFPEGRSIVIDSKVSLTAYVDYVAARQDDEKNLFLKKHIESVRRHVDELSRKDYSKTVSGAIGYVLMFVPNEASYILAVKNDEMLSADAYKKKIVVISPTNLIMALQLAYNLWQGERQSKNVEEIIRRANALYEKFATFSATFMDLGALVERLQSKFDEGIKQLTAGKGNITKQFEDLKLLGLSPKKEASQKLLEQMEE